jgi:hypothetical protein
VGRCDLCHEETGVLGREHRECSDAGKRIQLLVRKTALGSGNGSDFAGAYDVARQANTHRVVDVAPALAAWRDAVTKVLDDRILSADEETRLLTIAETVGIKQENGGEAWVRLVKAAILRDVTEGRIPERAQISGANANLMKKERSVWLFNGSKFLEEHTSRSFAGVSHGLSIRIAKGVYYRPSVFRGHPIESTKLVHVDNGNVLVTSHHLYLLGARKSSRVPYRKIVAFEPYKDGIGIQRDAMTAKPQIFTVDDAWFAYNLITNLAAIGAD